jgi:hypothetical protein
MDYTELITVLEEKLDLKDVSQEVKENVFIHLGDSILERTMLAIVSSLTEEEAKSASEQLQNGDIEAFLDMIQNNHPELNTIVVTITNEVINEFLEISRE